MGENQLENNSPQYSCQACVMLIAISKFIPPPHQNSNSTYFNPLSLQKTLSRTKENTLESHALRLE
jgi:hypothetical protein